MIKCNTDIARLEQRLDHFFALKNVNSCCNTKFSFYIEIFGGQNFTLFYIIYVIYYYLVRWVPGQGPEQRESDKTVLNVLIVIIILISYFIIYYY